MIYLGLSQWNYTFFKGRIYPDDSKPYEYIKYYSKEFNCVELNSTYYDEVKPDTIQRWKQFVNPAFKFCPKFPKEISHDKILKNVQLPVENFINSVLALGENLGTCFLQLPLNMNPVNTHLIDELLKFIDNRIKVSVELRPQWIANAGLLKECLGILKRNKAGVVIVDGAETVKYLNNIKLTNTTAFTRFLSYNHTTDYFRIDDWIKMIKVWRDKGVKDIYFILHMADSEHEPSILTYTKEKFEKELS